MASFTGLIAQCIHSRRDEFLAHLSTNPNDERERFIARGIQTHWHPFVFENTMHDYPSTPRVGAVDGSRAIRALNIGADWIIAQALLIGPDGLRLSAGDTLLLRGEIEHPAVDRCASLLMRSLELDLALKFVQNEFGSILLLDGSLYADLPYLLYNLAIGGYEELPLKVLGQYLDLFDLCQKRNILLLGIAKSTRSTVLGRTILESNFSSTIPIMPQTSSSQEQKGETEQNALNNDLEKSNSQPSGLLDAVDTHGLPSDGELLYRWTEGIGLSSPVLLGSASFGHTSAQKVAQLAKRAKQPLATQNSQLAAIPDRIQEHLTPLQERLLAAPAIGTFYARLTPGDDVLRIDALAHTFGRSDLCLLEFAHTLVPYTTALPILQHLLYNYGGLSVYNAALYVVDKEVRLHAETVDQIYLPVLRNQLGYPIQYDRSTRRFIS